MDLSVRQISRMTNVHKNTILKYTSTEDRYLSDGRLRVYWKIANGLNLQVEQLLFGLDYKFSENTLTEPITLYKAVERKSIWFNTNTMDIHNQIRALLNDADYQTFSSYENYRWVPTVADAIKISEYLNCTIDALWGEYFRGLCNAR